MARGITKIIGAIAAAALVFGGCGGPYRDKPQKLPRVKVNAKGEAAANAAAGPATTDIKYDDECSAKFADDPMKAKRSPGKAAPFVSQGGDFMDRANTSPDPQVQGTSIVSAIEQYKKALLEDNYNAEATFSLAVAYAKVRKKGCALKLLKRLGELQSNPKLAGGTARLESFLAQVEDEAAFKPFKNDALQAIGR